MSSDAAAIERLVRLLDRVGVPYADASVAREALQRRRQFNVIDPDTAFKIDLIIRKDRAYVEEWASELGVVELWHALLRGEPPEYHR